MVLNYDRQITISFGNNRKVTEWKPQTLQLSEFYESLRVPMRSTETLAEYLKLSKAIQDDLKDVGGFVAGTLQNNIRKANTVIGRDIITLDLDNIPAGGTNDTILRVKGLECSYIIYSTRKHAEYKPRLRVLIPTNRTVSADEYEPIARKVANLIGIALCDPTTFQGSRLMYKPSCCSDSNYIYTFGDKPFLDADGVLGMYSDWHNINEWPKVPGENEKQLKLAAKQQDPTTKEGIVGAFCRTYDIYRAMETFLPGVYEPCDDGTDRFTYAEGSTAGGAIIYENGSFIYSHHATDPIGGKLCNAFDFVRLHKFGELDDEALPGTPVNKLASYKAMCEFAVSDTYVAALINQERYEKATQDFEKPLEGTLKVDDELSFLNELEKDIKNGNVKISSTPKNLKIILEKDPQLKDKFAYDEFRKRIVVMGELPWRKKGDYNDWDDFDDSCLRNYLNDVYKIKGKDLYIDSFSEVIKNKSFHPIKDYLDSISWDGVKRIDTLFMDYFGVEDNIFVRSFSKKWLCGAVKRILEPGCKFDYMLVLVGNQGMKKSTFFSKLAKGYFTDSIQDVNGKKAIELIQGVWIVEFGELQAFNRSDNEAIKRFISATEDKYRPAYGRHTINPKRQCIFAGTTNKAEFLTDNTGNRRYWILDCTDRAEYVKKDVFVDLKNELDQIWAEALYWYNVGIPLYPTKEEEKYLAEFQEDYKSVDDVEQALIDRLNWEAPKEEWRDLTYTEILNALCLNESQKRYARNNLKQLLAKRGITQFKESTGARRRLYKTPPCIGLYSPWGI